MIPTYFDDTPFVPVDGEVVIRGDLVIRTPYVIRQGDGALNTHAYNLLGYNGNFLEFNDNAGVTFQLESNGTNLQLGTSTDRPLWLKASDVPLIKIQRDLFTVEVQRQDLTYAEGFRVQELLVASSNREMVAWNVNGSLLSRLPTDINPTLIRPGVGAHIGVGHTVVRAGGFPLFRFLRVNGSLQVPSRALNNDIVAFVGASSVDETGTFGGGGTFLNRLREDFGSTTRADQWELASYPFGVLSTVNTAVFRAGGSAISEWLGLATTRIVSGSTQIAFRNSANTADTFTVSGPGSAITFPLSTSFIIGTDPGGTQAFRLGGSMRVSGAAQFDADVIVDTDTFFVNSITNRVAVGTLAPGFRFQVESNLDAPEGVFVRNNSLGTATYSFVSAVNHVAGGTGNIDIRAYSSAHTVWPASGLLVTGSSLTGGLSVFVGAGDYSVWTGGGARFRVRSGGTGIAEWLSVQATTRIVSGATEIAFRDSANTANTFQVNAAGTAISFPLATSFIVGTDPGGTQLFRTAGGIRVQGTVGSLIRVDAATLAAPALLVESSTNGNNLGLTGFNLTRIIFNATNAGLNNKFWSVDTNNSGEFRLTMHNDALSANAAALIISRSATVPTIMNVSAMRIINIESIEMNAAGGTARFGIDASGTNIAAAAFPFRGPRSTGNATPAGYTWSVTAPGASGAAVQSGYFIGMALSWLSAGNTRLSVTGRISASQGYISDATNGIVFRDNTDLNNTFTINAAGTTVTIPLATAVVIGADPGGTQQLRTSGGINSLTVIGREGIISNVAAVDTFGVQFQIAGVNRLISRLEAGVNWVLNSRDAVGASIDRPLTIVLAAGGAITLGSTGNRQVIIDGAAWGAGVASLRFNGLTSGAGAAAGTLTNAPAAGNPAFWLPVNIAGTVRYIPCW